MRRAPGGPGPPSTTKMSSTTWAAAPNCLADRIEVSFFLMQKWFSSDGLTVWPEYSSTGPYDSLNLIEGTMRLAPGSTVKGLTISTGTPAVLDRLTLSNPGNLEYIDRTYRLTSIPSGLSRPRNDPAREQRQVGERRATTSRSPAPCRAERVPRMGSDKSGSSLALQLDQNGR